MDLIALVPMRHHSHRVPGKNYRSLAGRPLYQYILDTLCQVPEIREIVVDTDSPVIGSGVKASYPTVRLLERPTSLRGDRVPMNEILRHDVHQVMADFYLQTHSTNPLLRPETVHRAMDQFAAAFPAHDTLFGVTRLQGRLWDEQARAVNHEPQVLLPTQDLAPLFLENSCLYLFDREGFLRRGNRIGQRPLLFEIDPLEAVDIDDLSQFQLAEALLRRGTADGA